VALIFEPLQRYRRLVRSPRNFEELGNTFRLRTEERRRYSGIMNYGLTASFHGAVVCRDFAEIHIEAYLA
jgi:hypothetical protein